MDKRADKFKNIIIYSTIKIVDGNSAGSARILNYARALAINNVVYLISFANRKRINIYNIEEIEPNIFQVGKSAKYKMSIIQKLFSITLYHAFVTDILNFCDSQEKDCSLLLYPSFVYWVDIFSIFYFKKKYKIFLEVNEVKRYSDAFDNIHNINFIPKLKAKITKIIIYKIEGLSKYFNGIICISTKIESYYSRYNSNLIRIPILCESTNGVTLNKVLLKNENFKIAFTGGIGIIKENINRFFLILKRLKLQDYNIEFYIYGAIQKSDYNTFFSIMKSNKLDNFIFYKNFVPQSELKSILKQFHLLVIPRGATMQNQFGFSTKLAEYLSSGTPVLVTNVSDNALFIKDGINGYIVEPDNDDQMENKLKQIISNYNDEVSLIAKNAQELIKESFYYKNYAEKINEFLCG